MNPSVSFNKEQEAQSFLGTLGDLEHPVRRRFCGSPMAMGPPRSLSKSSVRCTQRFR